MTVFERRSPASEPSAQRPATSRDVARRAGVSRTTVSLVLNGKRLDRIAPATRQRVLDAARHLGYVPREAGRSLASGRTRTLGLVVGHTRHLAVDGFLPQVLTALGEEAHRAGFRVLVDAVEDPHRPDVYAERVRAGQIDGLIVVNPRSDDPALEALAASGYPVAIVGRLPGHPELCTADHDDDGGRRVGRHVLRQGRRRIAYLGFAPAGFRADEERKDGLREALAEAGRSLDGDAVRHAAFSADSGYRAMASWLAEGFRYDALFCGNDTIAFGALAALRDREVRVPDDVALVGFDDLPLARYAAPRLTSVRSHAAEHGRRAARSVLARLAGQDPASEAPLAPQLVVRRSCGATARTPTPEEAR